MVSGASTAIGLPVRWIRTKTSVTTTQTEKIAWPTRLRMKRANGAAPAAYFLRVICQAKICSSCREVYAMSLAMPAITSS